MFYDIDNCDIIIYANDNTPYKSDFNLEEVIQKPEIITSNLLELLKKANADKCHLLVTPDTDLITEIGEFDVKNSRKEKILGVKIDTKLSFKNHVLPFAKSQAKSTCTRKSCTCYGSSKT